MKSPKPATNGYPQLSTEDCKAKIQANIQEFLTIALALQHNDEHHAALDLSREALSAARIRRHLYKVKP